MLLATNLVDCRRNESCDFRGCLEGRGGGGGGGGGLLLVGVIERWQRRHALCAARGASVPWRGASAPWRGTLLRHNDVTFRISVLGLVRRLDSEEGTALGEGHFEGGIHEEDLDVRVILACTSVNRVCVCVCVRVCVCSQRFRVPRIILDAACVSLLAYILSSSCYSPWVYSQTAPDPC